MRSSRDELSECIRSSQPKREDAKKAKVRKGFLGDIFATFASSRLALRLRRSRCRCFVGFVVHSDWRDPVSESAERLYPLRSAGSSVKVSGTGMPTLSGCAVP